MLKYLKKAVEKPKEDIAAVRETVREILEKIREEGEAGLRYYSEKFDNWSPKKFRVTDDEILGGKKAAARHRDRGYSVLSSPDTKFCP